MTQEQVNQQQALARTQPGVLSGAVADPFKLAAVFHKSGLFKDIRDEAQAIVKIVYGAELGLAPMQAMLGVYVVDGKPTLAAATIATLIKRSGRYTFRVTAHDETHCEIAFYERAAGGWEQAGVSAFSLADAQAAGLAGKGPWKQYPRNMLWARALTNGARWYCADVFGGAVYTPEEFGAAVDEDGMPVPPPPAPLRTVNQDGFTERVNAPPPPARPRQAPKLDPAIPVVEREPESQPVTERAVEAIARRAEDKGIGMDAMTALLQQRYGAGSVWDLSREQAKHLYAYLSTLPDAPVDADGEPVESVMEL